MFAIKTIDSPHLQFDLMSPDGVNLMPKINPAPNEEFMKNACGFYLSDIAALNGCTSLQEYEVIAARLREYEAVNPDTSKMSTEELIQSVAPQSFQTPSEVKQFAECYGRYLANKVQPIVDAKIARKQAEAAVAAAKQSQVNYTEPTKTD